MIAELIELLTMTFIIFKLSISFVIAVLLGLLFRKLLIIGGLDNYSNELGFLIFLMAFILSWFFFFSSLLISGVALIVFYLFGGVLMSVATLIATVLK